MTDLAFPIACSFYPVEGLTHWPSVLTAKQAQSIAAAPVSYCTPVQPPWHHVKRQVIDNRAKTLAEAEMLSNV